MTLTAPLILGSQSPRRKEILNFFSIPFTCVNPVFDEDAWPFHGDPVRYVNELALEKGYSLQESYPEAIILTADTTVYLNGKVYNKPESEEKAIQLLRAMAGSSFSVYTGVAAIGSGIKAVTAVETKVFVNPLTEKQIQQYHQKMYCFDLAGGYAFHLKSGNLIINRIEGCYYNVMGLPISGLCQVLSQAGIDLWDHLKAYSTQ